MAIRSALVLVVLMVTPIAVGDERTMELVWLDAHGLFPDFERVRSEAGPFPGWAKLPER